MILEFKFEIGDIVEVSRDDYYPYNSSITYGVDSYIIHSIRVDNESFVYVCDSLLSGTRFKFAEPELTLSKVSDRDKKLTELGI